MYRDPNRQTAPINTAKLRLRCKQTSWTGRHTHTQLPYLPNVKMRAQQLQIAVSRIRTVQSRPTCWAELYILQPRAADPVAVGDDVGAGDLPQRCAAAERHGELQLVPQHLQHLPHAGLAVHCQREKHRPADLMQHQATVSGVELERDNSVSSGQWVVCVLTNTPEAPNARALNTSVPRRTPPSRNTGSRPFASLTTWIHVALLVKKTQQTWKMESKEAQAIFSEDLINSHWIVCALLKRT